MSYITVAAWIAVGTVIMLILLTGASIVYLSTRPCYKTGYKAFQSHAVALAWAYGCEAPLQSLRKPKKPKKKKSPFMALRPVVSSSSSNENSVEDDGPAADDNTGTILGGIFGGVFAALVGAVVTSLAIYYRGTIKGKIVKTATEVTADLRRRGEMLKQAAKFLKDIPSAQKAVTDVVKNFDPSDGVQVTGNITSRVLLLESAQQLDDTVEEQVDDVTLSAANAEAASNPGGNQAATDAAVAGVTQDMSVLKESVNKQAGNNEMLSDNAASQLQEAAAVETKGWGAWDILSRMGAALASAPILTGVDPFDDDWEEDTTPEVEGAEQKIREELGPEMLEG